VWSKQTNIQRLELGPVHGSLCRHHEHIRQLRKGTAAIEWYSKLLTQYQIQRKLFMVYRKVCSWRIQFRSLGDLGALFGYQRDLDS
jgi:hypothetical protein